MTKLETEKNTLDILKHRAEKLSHERKNTDIGEETIEVVEFKLADEHYAIESSYAQEVYPLKGVIPLPCTPPFIYGLINVRRKILSIVDLKYFFELPAQPTTPLSKVIILGNEENEFGLLADIVIGVRAIALKDLQTSLPTLTGLRQEFLKGVTQERLIVLDGLKLLTDKHLIVNATDE